MDVQAEPFCAVHIEPSHAASRVISLGVLRFSVSDPRLETAEAASLKHEKRDKQGGPTGWGVFASENLYHSYLKRAENVPYTQEDYEKAKAADPEFYRWVPSRPCHYQLGLG
jgi:hypothetical protein